MLVGDMDVVNCGFPGVGHQNAFGSQRVAEANGLREIDHAVERHRRIAGVVGRKRERRIREGKGDSAVHGFQSVDHFLFYGHLDEAVFFADFNEFYAHPLGKIVLIEHVLGGFEGSHFLM